MLKTSDRSVLIYQWLWRYYDAKRDSIRLEYEYNEMCSIQESAGAISYDGMPGGSCEIPDLSGMVAAREAALSRLVKARRKEIQTYSEIVSSIDKLDYSIEKDIVSMRYTVFSPECRKLDWEDIAGKLLFSQSHIKKVHGIAIQKLIRIVGDSELKRMIRNDTL